MEFKIIIKEQLNIRNNANPNSPKMTLGDLAQIVGTSSQTLSQLGKRFSKNLNKHLEVIFNSDEKDIIKATWNIYLQKNIIILNRIEKIRIAFGCEIWDLIKKV